MAKTQRAPAAPYSARAGQHPHSIVIERQEGESAEEEAQAGDREKKADPGDGQKNPYGLDGRATRRVLNGSVRHDAVPCVRLKSAAKRLSFCYRQVGARLYGCSYLSPAA